MFTLLHDYLPLLLEGFARTLLASAIALVASFLWGSLVGIWQSAGKGLLKAFATTYVEIFRNIPLLVIVMFFYVVLPLFSIKLSGFTSGVIALSLYTSSFIADIIATAIKAIPRGQFEAGLSQGFTARQCMAYLIFPQAFRQSLPALGNQVINLVKNSSILAMVAGLDLMYYGDLVALETFDTFASYSLVAGFYLLLTVPLTLFIQKLEKNYSL
ncbi:amino acid ABC transporter permease [Aerococcus sp. UMB7834]|uniref:amino acid ABC transporter permease n=1 Tax=Aerococcus sp. UMB7834 TaxID=3046342 RepID=UPI00254B30C2|nr:amino acid ABC transporter permease [Aerococcus sp. UMB7834]MDK6805917.1 amino acid ABC transporter permease [Aerococcus sp. UMB7834]